ncbi:hypothetical protein DPEC_G00270120 [Dallia pectoralis]|uniref:Uncharacterized protein n=1 Tax=Dallia pectoralis TaxID=75939 RepID=A0ACC2FPJ1_DALPE|nr:hypothetical protein DPEC_G00270120 [Dallia pectoralis]
MQAGTELPSVLASVRQGGCDAGTGVPRLCPPGGSVVPRPPPLDLSYPYMHKPDTGHKTMPRSFLGTLWSRVAMADMPASGWVKLERRVHTYTAILYCSLLTSPSGEVPGLVLWIRESYV